MVYLSFSMMLYHAGDNVIIVLYIFIFLFNNLVFYWYFFVDPINNVHINWQCTDMVSPLYSFSLKMVCDNFKYDVCYVSLILTQQMDFKLFDYYRQCRKDGLFN